MSARENANAGAAVARAIGRIYRAGLTTTSGGNISVRDGRDNVWITPKAFDKGRLEAGDIVFVTPDGEVTGRREPSSEYPFHRAIYDQCPDIDAIVHAHPAALVACSIVNSLPPMEVIPRASRICGGVGFAPYAMTGSEELGENIAAEFRKGNRAVIMENHGTVVGGRDLDEAFARFEVFECVARTVVNASRLGTPRPLGDGDAVRHESPEITDLPASARVVVGEHDAGRRTELADMVQRAYEQGMLLPFFGSLSVRLDDDEFLVTPRDMICTDITPADIVCIRDGHGEEGKAPSRAACSHRAIYSAHPEIEAVITARPPHLMAFAVAGVKPEVRTIPESWLFLQDMPLADFGAPCFDSERFSALFGPGSPAVLVANDAVYVTGSSLLEAFDRLEVAEFTARSLLMSRSLGELSLISDRQIDELKKQFFPGAED